MTFSAFISIISGLFGKNKHRQVITLTGEAWKQVKQFKKDTGARFIRAGINWHESESFEPIMDLVMQVDKGDYVIDRSGPIPIVILAEHVKYLQGTCVDWRSKDGASGFFFDNPNVTYEWETSQGVSRNDQDYWDKPPQST